MITTPQPMGINWIGLYTIVRREVSRMMRVSRLMMNPSRISHSSRSSLYTLCTFFCIVPNPLVKCRRSIPIT